MTFCFLACYSKRKEFASKGNKFFSLRVDPIFRKEKISLRKLSPLEMYPSTVKVFCLLSEKRYFLKVGKILIS